MRLRHAGALAVLVILFAKVLVSADDSTITTMGPGATTCAQFGKDYQRDPSIETVYFAWAQGFMSGLNMGILTRGGNQDTVDLAKSRRWNQKRC